MALGLGLVMPGGGFLVFAAGTPMQVATHVGMTLATLAAFGGALVAWFGSGNIVAPVAVWLGAMLWSASMAHGAPWSHAMAHGASWPQAVIVVPGLALAAAACQFVLNRRRFQTAVARGHERNRYLANAQAVETPTSGASQLPLVEELSREDVSAMRFCSTARCSRSISSTATAGSSSFRRRRCATS